MNIDILEPLMLQLRNDRWVDRGANHGVSKEDSDSNTPDLIDTPWIESQKGIWILIGSDTYLDGILALKKLRLYNILMVSFVNKNDNKPGQKPSKHLPSKKNSHISPGKGPF